MISLSGCFSGVCYTRADCFQFHKKLHFCQTVKVQQQQQLQPCMWRSGAQGSATVKQSGQKATEESFNLLSYINISEASSTVWFEASSSAFWMVPPWVFKTRHLEESWQTNTACSCINQSQGNNVPNRNFVVFFFKNINICVITTMLKAMNQVRGRLNFFFLQAESPSAGHSEECRRIHTDFVFRHSLCLPFVNSLWSHS